MLFFWRTFLCGGSAPQPPSPHCHRLSMNGGGLGGSGPQEKNKSEQCPRAIKDSETVHRHFSYLATSRPRFDHQPVASRSPTSQPISQSGCNLSFVCHLLANRQPSNHADKQANSQPSQPTSQPTSQPAKQPNDLPSNLCESVTGCWWLAGWLVLGGGWLMPVGCGMSVVFLASHCW